jgi:hypothetical protein
MLRVSFLCLLASGCVARDGTTRVARSTGASVALATHEVAPDWGQQVLLCESLQSCERAAALVPDTHPEIAANARAVARGAAADCLYIAMTLETRAPVEARLLCTGAARRAASAEDRTHILNTPNRAEAYWAKHALLNWQVQQAASCSAEMLIGSWRAIAGSTFDFIRFTSDGRLTSSQARRAVDMGTWRLEDTTLRIALDDGRDRSIRELRCGEVIEGVTAEGVLRLESTDR